MIVIPELAQGTEEWLKTRLGVLTASRVDSLLTPTGKLSAQRDGLINQLVAESIIGELADDFQGTYWTDRGSMLEDQAGAYFALQTGLDPEPVGFVFRDDNRDCGCSPDWLIKEGDKWIAGVEVKCPKASTHIGYLRDGVAKKYDPQVQFSLWVTGLPKWYFMSYFPGLRPLLRYTEPDCKWQDAFSEHVPTFIAELKKAKELVAGMVA